MVELRTDRPIFASSLSISFGWDRQSNKRIPMNKLLLSLLLCTPLLAGAQEVETYITGRPERPTSQESGLLKGNAVVSLPFIDDFSVDHFANNIDGNTVLWENELAHRNLGFGLLPPTVGVVTLDGLDANGRPYKETTEDNVGHCDTLTSMPMDLSDKQNVVISFYFQPEGLGERPEANDSLILQCYIPSLDIWENRWSTTGTSVMPFQQVLLSLGVQYLQEDFQFRFINYGSQEGSLDVWHLDWIWLDENRSTTDTELIDVGFAEPLHSLLTGDLFSMPWSHFQADPEAYMLSTKNIRLQNNRELGAFINESGYEVNWDSESALFTDTQSPSIPANSAMDIQQEINTNPNDFVYDTDAGGASADFDVRFFFSTSPDINAESNEYTFTQHFSDYYAYDDGEAERGYGFSESTNLGKLALRFDIMEADSLSGIDLYLLPGAENAENALVYLAVWADEGGEPGEDIYEDLTPRDLFYSERNTYVRYCLDSALYVEPGPIWIGLRQVSAGGNMLNINIGNDKNHNSNADRLRFETNGVNGWQTTSIVGSLMMRAALSTPCVSDMPVSLPELRTLEPQVWPVPTDGLLTIRLEEQGPFDLRLLDLKGRTLLNEQMTEVMHTLDLGSIHPGVYLLQLSDRSGRASTTKRIVISE